MGRSDYRKQDILSGLPKLNSVYLNHAYNAANAIFTRTLYRQILGNLSINFNKNAKTFSDDN